MNVPSSWLVIGGAFVGFGLSLLLTFPLIIWLGWSSKRERELEGDVCVLLEYIDELLKLETQSAETRREGREDE